MHEMRGALAVCAAVLAGLLFACNSDDDGGSCLAAVAPAILVEIRDSMTGQGLASRAVATVTDDTFGGPFTDTLYLLPDPDSAYRAGPDHRAGMYHLSITSPGYQTWVRSDIWVRRGPCTVETVRLVAPLQQ
jgi:hypothetical protein